ncbi:MAG TPA: DUF2155 domain-containing protein [Stellaceae bacterium]|nr:DUF2155 domain-containing protein [Stellaceae bacterium]
MVALRRWVFGCGFSVIALALTPVAAQADTVAMLQGLDKTTARATKFEASVGRAVRFGTLTITVRDCRKRPPEEQPETAAFLEISETKPGEPVPRQVFSGWMFASSPALSALEHPVYDVWVLDCKTDTTLPGKSG